MQPSKPASKPESLESRAQAFIDAYERATSDPAVFKAIERKFWEALFTWAIMKMGVRRQQYLAQAHRDFPVLCALRMVATNRSAEDVVNELSFELPLRLTNKRMGFVESIPQLYTIAAEYEKVCEVARLAKTNVNAAPKFRLNLREKLERFAEEEELKPAPTREKLDGLIRNYHLRTQPSDIAAAYVGKRYGTSAANIKKLVGIMRDPARMAKTLGKYLKTAYLPKDFEAIKQSLTDSPPPHNP